MKKSLLKYLITSLFLAFLAIVMTWPLVLHLNTHIPGGWGDNIIFVWNNWWVKYALLDLGKHPFHCPYLFAPNGVSLAFHTLTLLTSLLTIPLGYLAEPIASFNMMFLLGFVASGLGMLFLLKTIKISPKSAWIGTLIFCFSPYVMVRSTGHFNLAAVWPLPWAIALILRLRERQDYQSALWLGLVWGLALLNELQYAFFIGLFALVVFGRNLLINLGKRDLSSDRGTMFKNWPKSILLFTSLGGTFFLVAWPGLLPVLNQIRAGASQPANLAAQNAYSLDILSLFAPDRLHPVWGRFFANARTKIGIWGVENIGYLGIVNMFLLGIGFWLHRKSKLDRKFLNWTALALVWLVLAWGPFLTIGGQSSFTIFGQTLKLPLPFIILRALPFSSLFRTPNRLIVLTYLCLAVANSLVVEALLTHFPDQGRKVKALVPLLGIVILFDFFTAPFPLSDARLPSFYQEKQAFENIQTILDIPVGWRSGSLMVGNLQTAMQHYQTAHQKKLIGGYISRVPAEMMHYYTHRPGMAGFMEPWRFAPWEANQLNASPQQAAQTLADLGIDGIVVHADLLGQETARYVEEFLTRMGWKKILEKDNKSLYTKQTN